MASRLTYSGLSAPPLAGEDFFNEYAARLKTLFDASALPLTAVGGTANAVTATLDPALDGGGLVDGMKFGITWAAANTAGVTLALNGGSALPVVDAGGNALVADSLAAGLRSVIEYISGGFRILSPLSSTGSSGSARYYQAFTASGTWTKPAGLDPDTMVTIEAWGGGGGSNGNRCGGGAAYAPRRIRLGDLPSSVAVTIGAGGVGGGSATDGGDTTFGSILTAYGGGRGRTAGGAGAGSLQKGGNSSTAMTAAIGGRIGGGNGGASGIAANDGQGFGGGGGGHGLGDLGGWATFGGGGGGDGVGGVSKFGGNGGSGASAGSAPGGGGGNNAPGARGEVRVWI